MPHVFESCSVDKWKRKLDLDDVLEIGAGPSHPCPKSGEAKALPARHNRSHVIFAFLQALGASVALHPSNEN
jgi:hypothetical protein